MADSWRRKRSMQERVSRAVESMSPGVPMGRLAQNRTASRTESTQRPAQIARHVTFSHPGTLTGTESSPGYLVRQSGTIMSVALLTTNSGAKNVTAVVKVDGTTITTITLSGTGTSNVVDEMNYELDVNDVITITSTLNSGTAENTSLIVEVLED